MKTRLFGLWETLRTSLWFVPALMALGALGLSVVTTSVDGEINLKLARSVGWLWSGGPDGARTLLSTIAGSMITVAGVVFSITVVALALASQQFGPRLLRNFMRDPGNQFVLGTFIATFLYCLLVLRTVRSTHEQGGFVPYVSVTCGLLLSVASLGVLIYFIHHVAGSIQAENLVAVVGAEFKASIARLYPEEASRPPEADCRPPEGGPARLCAEKSGYLQTIDREGLLDVAQAEDLCLRLLHRPGDFVLCGETLAQVWPAAASLIDPAAERLQNAFHLGPRRTPTQDAGYGIRQLLEIACRALSPGINDPFTAMGCLDWMADALGELAQHTPSPGCRRDDRGKARLWEEPVTFGELVDLGFDPVRSYGKASPMVTLHLLGTLTRLAARVGRDEDRAALRRQAEHAADAGCQACTDAYELRRLQDALAGARRALAPTPAE